MNFLRDKVAFILDYVRRERLYFFAILLALLIIAVSQPPSQVSAATSSPALNQLQQAAQEWETSVHDPSAWLQILEKNPTAILVWGLMLALFFGFFFCGILFLILYQVRPGFVPGLQSRPFILPDIDWSETVFFRVLALIFSLTVILGFIAGHFWIETPENENLMGLLGTLAVDGLACLSIYAVLKSGGMKWDPEGMNSLQYRIKEIPKGLMVYTAVFPIFILSLLATIGISEWMHYEPPAHPLVKIFVEEEGRSAFVFQLALILASVGAPFFEEIFFRGFVYRLFKSWWGGGAAAGISAAFFAGMHGSGFAFFPIFILGLSLAWIYEKRGNLTACWTFHILHNILFTGYFFAVKTLLIRH